jgi:hypothetical protein
MKKIISIIISVSFVFAMISTTTAYTKPDWRIEFGNRSELNEDRFFRINVLIDGMEILRYLAGMDSIIELDNEFWKAASAITGGDIPTIFDALECFKFAADMESVFGCVWCDSEEWCGGRIGCPNFVCSICGEKQCIIDGVCGYYCDWCQSLDCPAPNVKGCPNYLCDWCWEVGCYGADDVNCSLHLH